MTNKPGRGKSLGALNKRMAARPDSEILWQTIIHLTPGDETVHLLDRAFAMVLGAILEQGLETAILSHFVEMSEQEKKDFFGPPEGSPVSFELKIRLAHALGVYGSDAKADLNCIRYVRNAFAHARTEISFNDVDVINVCDYIKWIESYPWGGVGGERPKNARARFWRTVLHFFAYLALPPEDGTPLKYLECPSPRRFS